MLIYCDLFKKIETVASSSVCNYHTVRLTEDVTNFFLFLQFQSRYSNFFDQRFWSVEHLSRRLMLGKPLLTFINLVMFEIYL